MFRLKKNKFPEFFFCTFNISKKSYGHLKKYSIFFRFFFFSLEFSETYPRKFSPKSEQTKIFPSKNVHNLFVFVGFRPHIPPPYRGGLGPPALRPHTLGLKLKPNRFSDIIVKRFWIRSAKHRETESLRRVLYLERKFEVTMALQFCAAGAWEAYLSRRNGVPVGGPFNSSVQNYCDTRGVSGSPKMRGNPSLSDGWCLSNNVEFIDECTRPMGLLFPASESWLLSHDSHRCHDSSATIVSYFDPRNVIGITFFN